jgi:hypothetical protein
MKVRKRTFKLLAILCAFLWVAVVSIGFFIGDNIVDIAVSEDGKYIVNLKNRKLYFFDEENLVNEIEFSRYAFLFEHSERHDVIYVKHNEESYTEYDFKGNIIDDTNNPITNSSHQNGLRLNGLKKENDKYILQCINYFGYEKLILTEKISGNVYELKDVSNLFYKIKAASIIPALPIGMIGFIGVYLICTRNSKYKDYFY